MAMLLFNALFLLAFLLSAAVQYNDPDALAWIVIYLAAGAMCLAWFARRCPRWLPMLLLLACLLWIGTLLPGLGSASVDEIFASISMQTRAVEEAREIGGLALVALWATVLTLRGNR
ncbi:MAG: hypothetical protein CME59_21375 [Halioglobus sp.]|nr:hypothetical protein [Halioglobus sp.]|tara:strand:+ start:357 stop:707 length:351 start_codon:yes stop_codon:yes gene_type:complete